MISFALIKPPNIFELFSIFVTAFFTRNVSRADWVAKDGACGTHRIVATLHAALLRGRAGRRALPGSFPTACSGSCRHLTELQMVCVCE
ncbi:hypothetical protein C0Z16_32590 [Paraburkholderia rhynchosiae]|uniref:Secreted protein n=1 Tax=Paraburkholderia rhynchosiae TaxID=487049 RepID=A0ABX4UV27_9BURK|nr:hypothetical protein C0Z16_32590 [Paraburkholderia rhynchosiae]